MKKFLALFFGLLLWITAPHLVFGQAHLTNIILGHSGGAGLVSDLRRVIERDKIWEKYGLNVKAVYFNSGSLLTQAMAGGNIVTSDSDVPAMLNLSISGVADVKLVAVTINRLEHVVVVRKNIMKPEDLKGKRIAVSRIGSASDIVTRMVLRAWKIDPEKEVNFLQAGNTPTRVAALAVGHVDAALVSPEGVYRIIATGCCRVLADISELPLDYARFGVSVLTSLIRTQRDAVRRMLMAYIEGIYIYKTRPAAAYAVMEESGIKDPAVQKDLYDRVSKSFREYPIPETNGVQSALDSLTHPNAKATKPASLMDTSIIEEIKKSGFIDKLYGRTS
jgi:ABC-type nitrate/sulfonate/bicarbonate transport system substrate-binding protein